MMDASFTLDVTGTGGTVPPVKPPSGGDNPGGGSTPGGSTPGGGSTGGGDGGGAIVIVAAAGAVAAGVVGYGVYNYVSGQKLQACCRKVWLHPRTAPRPRCCCGTPQAVPSLPTLRPLQT